MSCGCSRSHPPSLLCDRLGARRGHSATYGGSAAGEVRMESLRQDYVTVSRQCLDGRSKELDAKSSNCDHKTAKKLGWIGHHKTRDLVKEAPAKKSAIFWYGADGPGNEVHQRLFRRNQFSWTALISEDVNCGRYRQALGVYKEMQEEGVKPSTYTFVYVLKACSSLGDLETGKKIHAQVIQSGNESQIFVATMLVDMYAKCGNIRDARRVFDNLPHPNVVCWNAMILGYAKKEEGEVALELYAQMQQEGIPPNERTFVAALKACSSLAALEEGSEVDRKSVKMWCLEKGKSIHLQVEKSGFEANLFVGTMLVDMYAKCGSMVDARQVFDRFPRRNVVCWNAVILGYAEEEDGEMALELYERMQREGVIPDDRTFVSAIKACCGLAVLEDGKEIGGSCVKIRCLERGRLIHSQVVETGFESDAFVVATLVDMYVKCGSMVDACHVFKKLPHPDVVSWTAMILAHAKKEEGDMALELYAQMQCEGVAPNDRTFVAVLKACSSLAAQKEGTEADRKLLRKQWLEKGRAIHMQAAKSGFESDAFVGNTLIDMYVKCGSMLEARDVFDKLPRHDVVCWTAMILGYAEHGEIAEAFEFYAQMQKHGLSPNSWTFVSILKACGNTAALEIGREIHAKIRRAGLETAAVVANTLIDMYGKCGSMVDARELFDALPTRDLVAWSALMAGYARQGESGMVFHLFDRMRQEGIQPDGVTFLSVFTACSHAVLAVEGLKYFEVMNRDYGITPTIEHYNSIVDLLGRAGQLEKALAMVQKMPLQPNVVTWTSLLGACRKWKNVEIGRHAYECAVRLDEKYAAAYVLMSKIYADAHMWEDRDKVQAMRKKAWAWQKPGESWWSDADGTVHTFAAGDWRHLQSINLLAKLKELSVKMEEGYVPDFDSVLEDMSDNAKEDALCGHSEKLAIAFALINTPPRTPVRIVKNLRLCDDCHQAIALISKIEVRNILCRDATRFHVYNDGKCSCGDNW